MTEKRSEGRGSGTLRERPPKKRIDEILKNRDWAKQHLHMRYEARRDYLQLCTEVEHLRAEAAQRSKTGLEPGELHDECVDGNPCLQRGCPRCEGYKGQAGDRTNG